ncbi:MAG: ROK family protein [Candidatus Bathyarchaeia archaeon]
MDIGATKIRCALFNSPGEMIQKVTAPTPKEGVDAISRRVIELIDSFRHRTSIVGIGIGSIGPIDMKRGIILVAPNLDLRNIPIVKPIKEEFKLPVAFLNDCVAAVNGEKTFGAGKDVNNLVYVTFSTGIGGGVYVDGHLLLGKDGNAHEVGHFVVDNRRNLKCGCGGFGHWEAYCSGRNLPNFARVLIEELYSSKLERSYLMEACEGDLNRISVEMMYEGAKRNDELCVKILGEVNDLNARGLACIINAYDPELISIGGAIAMNNPDLVVGPVVKNVGRYTANRVPEILLTPLGEDVVLYGAFASIRNMF